ncbi:hypothetical protein ACFFGQ_18805 [Rufibacter quisquiliarum]|uniref:hypothetical protein n=1 Tax=Rufibacter quisquiliarum TaxID=1549639 RepID=UPI0035E62374
MKKEVYTSFSELRRTSEQMLRLVQRTLAGNVEINLRTSINYDLGILGLDWDIFLEEYEVTFKAQLHGLIYTDYFDEEVPPLKDILLIPIRIFWLLLVYIPARLVGINKNRIFWYKEQPPLTVGDLVLSAIAGQFVKREKAEIKIKNTSRNNS